MNISKAAAAYKGTLKTLATEEIIGYRSTEEYYVTIAKSRHGVIANETHIGHPLVSDVG